MTRHVFAGQTERIHLRTAVTNRAMAPLTGGAARGAALTG
jgi:hypothetical protein